VKNALVLLRVGAIAVGAMPAASFLATLTHWWRSPTPLAAFWSAVTAIVVLIVIVAFAGPWRRSRLGPVAVLAVITYAVTIVGVTAMNSRIIIDGPLGASRIVAGRFYGMNNQSFALVTVSGLIVAAVLAQMFRARGQRVAAVLTVLGVGALAVVVDGMPTLGADFGGPPALVTGFLLLAVVVAGWRMRRMAVLAVLGGAAAVTIGFALADYLRPPGDRTHLGQFVATSLAGGVGSVVGRKLSASFHTLQMIRYTGPTALGAAMTVWLCGQPHWFARWRGRLAALVKDEPLLTPTAACVAVALGIGFFVNDSGAVIPGIGLTLAIPALLALVAAWLGEKLAGSPSGWEDLSPSPCLPRA
jgi:hypothetical protein